LNVPLLKKLLLAVSLSGLAFSALAADEATEAVVRKALSSLAPDVKVDTITQSPLPGFYQVIASGQLVYISTDGKYLLNGDLLDLTTKKNISENAWADFRKVQLAKLPESQRIVFAAANPKYKVTVFTDVNCGYCRALHEHIADFNKAGISVEYVAWPREGVTSTSGAPTPTYTEMVNVWCAANPKMAFTEAKQGKTPKAATCTNPVKDEFELGLKLGVTGTPTIVADDGRVVGGYVTPDQLIQALQKGKTAGG
jgi:thiol:disulfide interchange protein DsbC